MALYIATDDSTTSLIAKCITEQQIVDAIQLKFGNRIGQLKYELYPQHAYNSKNIVTAQDITGFEDGWVYPNGTYISQELFPDAYDALIAMNYDDILIPGSPKTKIFSGVADGKTYHLIQLPKIEGYFYPNTDLVKDTIHHRDAEWQLNNHKHLLSFAEDDPNANNELTIKDGAWIWTTVSVGKKDPDYYPSRLWGNEPYQITIPKTSTAHRGDSYLKPNTNNTKLMQWSIPVKLTDDVKYNTKIQGISGSADNNRSSHLVSDTARFQPCTLNCSIMMFVGFPHI